MKKTLLSTVSFLFLSLAILAQVPYAFRYQASVRDDRNKPIIEEVRFDILLFVDASATEEIYSESHTLEPDTNGLVAFSIGEGLTNDNFSSIVWGDGPYYIQVLLDGEEISFSQLVSVPYAMHAQTADKIHNLQSPVLSNDPTTKAYVDNSVGKMQDSLNTTLNYKLTETSLSIDQALLSSKAYADSLAITPKDLDVVSSGDTLVIGNTKLVIPGMSSDNQPKYQQQYVLGGSYNEQLVKTLQCQDSSYLLIGLTYSGNGDIVDFKGDADIWMIKLSKNFTIEWTKTLGGSRYDNPHLVIEESDGFLIGATTESSDGDIKSSNGEFDIWLVKLNPSGDILWQNTYGGAGTEFINAIIPKGDGSYFIGATTFSNGGDVTYQNGESDIWVFELNVRKEITNSVSIGGSKYDALTSMTYDDNTLMLYGTSSSNDGSILQNNGVLDFVSIELNEELEVLNQECLGSTTNEQLTHIHATSQGTLLAGSSFSDNWSITRGNALKNIYLEHAGNTSWNTQLGGSGSDILVDLIITNDTITILAQTSSQNGDINDSKGAADIWIFSLTPEGDIAKSKVLGGTYDETPRVLKPLKNGEWLVGSESESLDGDLTTNAGEKDIWIIKLDKDFNIIWKKSYGGSYNELLTDIIVIDNNNFIICGSTSSNDYSITGLHDKAGKSSDIWLLKTTIE